MIDPIACGWGQARNVACQQPFDLKSIRRAAREAKEDLS
jgi:hypothetical protein